MSERERIILTPDEAKSLLAITDGYGHCQTSSPMCIIGCDWSEESIHEAIDSADTLEIGGPICIGMGHGVVCYPKGSKFMHDLKFFEHDREKMEAFLEDALAKAGVK